MLEHASIFVVACLLLGKALTLCLIIAIGIFTLYYFGWRRLFPRDHDPKVPAYLAVLLCVPALALLFLTTGPVYQLLLQARDFFDAVFN